MLDAGRLAELDAFLLELNRLAAAAILPLFRAEHGLEDKAGGGRRFDPVTTADRDAEAAIRAHVAARYPDHGVVGEEYGEDRPDAEHVWIVDPIDGTAAFVAGLPLWTTLIGLRVEGRPVLGSIGQPFLGEIFLGHAGAARRVDRTGERPLRTRACANLRAATIATTDPEAWFDETEHAAWTSLRAASRLARLGCDAYAYAMVAAGTIDLVVEAGLKPWDVAATIPVIEGAGGAVTDWRGAPNADRGGQIAIAGDRACHAQALALLGPAAK